MADPTQPLPPAYIAADEGPQLDAITIAVFTLAVVAVTLRFLARVLIKAPIWWDDFLILVALVFAVGPFVLTLYMVRNSFGKHAAVAGTPAVLNFSKCLYIFEILYPLPIAATKFSILLYYRRIFQVQSFRWPLYIVAGLISIWLIYVEGAAIFTCMPIGSMWDPEQKGRCIDIHKFFIGIAVPNVITDIALLTMPLPYMWKLQVATPKKIAVMFVFLLGGFVTVVSIIRLSVLLKITQEDVTWTYVPTCIWTNIEVMIGVVTASVPALWPLIRALATGSLHSATTRHTRTNASLAPIHSHNHVQPKQYLGRRRNTDDEEGFLHLKDLAVEPGSGPTSPDVQKHPYVHEREVNSPGLAKPEQTARTPSWR